MALDGIFINKLIKELKILIGIKIHKIYQLGSDEFLFNLKGKENNKLLISVNPVNYRIHTSKKSYITPKEPSSFVMFLRKHLEGGVIKDIDQISLDRIIIITVIKHNELKDLEEKKIIIELVGKASNLILCDNNFIILDSYKHVINVENDKVIIPKSLYTFSISKENIFKNLPKEQYFLSKKELQDKYYGISPMLYEAYINSNNFDFFNDIKNINITPVTFRTSKDEFYFYNLLNKECKEYSSLCELLDEFYHEKANTSIIKQKTNNLDTSIKKIIERTKRKLSNQEIELDNAIHNEEYKIKGELITANLYQLPSKTDVINVFNYYTNEFMDIKLDSSLTVKENALYFFNKYQKMKKATIHLARQITKTKDEIEYLSLIIMQINYASISDIKEIENELISNKYLTQKKNEKRKEKIHLLTYIHNDFEILVGKNNIQNELITHKLSKYNELWFHVKDGPGSHVVLKKTDNITESDIRTCAMIAAYYSNYRESSSVEIVYTLVKYIKKIPGQKNCFVTFSNEKTIFIDPSSEFINDLIVK